MNDGVFNDATNEPRNPHPERPTNSASIFRYKSVRLTVFLPARGGEEESDPDSGASLSLFIRAWHKIRYYDVAWVFVARHMLPPYAAR